MNDMDKGVSLGLVLGAVTLFGGIFMAYITQSPDEKFVRDKDNSCKVVQQQDTDEKIYCGKACWSPTVINTYQCGNGKTYTITETDRR